MVDQMIDEKITINCTDNGKNFDAHILAFKPKAFLEVAMQTLKIRMAYQERTKVFVGSVGGREFTVKENDLPQERKEYNRR
jgi:hypothetical protein